MSDTDNKEIETIVTHSGRFHADEVIGCMVLLALFPHMKLVRSRDPEVINAGRFVVDVGGKWDPASGRFDHHQSDFTGCRSFTDGEDNIIEGAKYASSGLVWKEFGEQFVRRISKDIGVQISDSICTKVAREVDAAFIRYIDLVDTGEDKVAPGYSGLSNLISAFNISWIENPTGDAEKRTESQFKRFELAIQSVHAFIHGIVATKISHYLAGSKVKNSKTMDGGRILILDQPGIQWTQIVSKEMPDVMFVIYPDSDTSQYQIRTVSYPPNQFYLASKFPGSWAGLSGSELAKVCGIEDAMFCHKGLFIAGARSLEGAIGMARKSMEPRDQETLAQQMA